ncbi:hypothetical protein LL845_000106 [Salmonella enterica]|uniref:Uncharacterized protein n=2 Tax=Salmonella enterica I TaxID=59201 RepID=A0A737EEA7_SALNE|nr:hypothetical protein [Salmonella enterica]EBP3754921.1 hypothetical protein [Salmonella enterica subsp. enterica]EBW9332035.1 hypothetical protein [Salmonella enterica subsp. enterica serovar Arechavaleta]ECI3102427.1 hypothetical protein [Salmonella enterica subsp. enterica serovar Montevideo]ECS6028698.1 hypothetical protein [Salmonella enterica subsp. enterica serovar Saintpaul]ECU8318132.1 hypothetical protein [Salmonella enterica subsp. enterica serovar Thompson]ECU9815698.1 hypotheti
MSEKYIETHVIRYYHNGAHAGNIRLCVDVDSWGMNADESAKIIKEKVINTISSLNYEHETSYGSLVVFTPHPLTEEQIKEWVDLAEVKRS